MSVGYVGKTLMKFEEMGIMIRGEPVNIKPANLIGFLPVFASKEAANSAGWDNESIIEINIEDDEGVSNDGN